MMRQITSALSGASAFDPNQLDFEYQQEQKHEDALRRCYATANFQQAELDVRAAQHRIKFSPTTLPHHRAAVLDFLDDPTAPTHLTPMHAMQFQALDEDDKVTLTMAHPANLAAFLITSRYAARYGWQSEHYTAERAKWSVAQWLDYESQEREQLRETRAECFATGTLKILQFRDFRAGTLRISAPDPSPR